MIFGLFMFMSFIYTVFPGNYTFADVRPFGMIFKHFSPIFASELFWHQCAVCQDVCDTPEHFL